MREFPAPPAQAAAFARHLAHPRHLQVSLSFGEAVDPARLRSSWAAVTACHGILRSARVKGADGTWSVREMDTAEAFWRSLDWQSETKEAIPGKWSDLLAADATNPFDLGAAPLVRFHEIRLPGGGAHYLLTVPAFLLDESSVALLLTDWLRALEGAALEEPVAVETLPPVAAPAWKELLEGSTGPLRVRMRTKSAAPSGTAALLLGRDETSAFKDSCRTQALAPAAVLQALWAFVLRRLGATGNVTRVLIGMRGESRAVGLLENELPVVQHFGGTVGEWLAKSDRTFRAVEEKSQIGAEAALQAAECGFPFGEIAASFAWRGAEVNDIVHTALPRWINVDARLQSLPTEGLHLEVRDGFRLHLRLTAADWPEAVAADVLGRLHVLMSELPALLDKPLRHIPVLSPEEVRLLRDCSRGPEAATGAPEDLVVAFRQTVARNGSSVAVRDGDYALTYEELDALSDRVAGHLSHAGLAGGWHVGLFLSHSSWIPIALIGSWKAGNTVIPLDPAAPPEWIEATLASNDAAVVLCDAASAPLLDTTNRRRVVLDQEWDGLEVANLPQTKTASDQPAAVLPGHFDGAPPQIRALTHGLLCSALVAGVRLADLKPGDVFLAHSPAGGGAFFDEWLLPLVAGATVRVADDDLLDPATAEATHVRMSAPEWTNQAARWRREDGALAPMLRRVLVEAGHPNVRALDTWESKFPGGSTIFWSPAGLLGLGLCGQARRTAVCLPAGLPGDGVEAFVCDPDGHDVPAGFAGELFLRFAGWKAFVDGKSKRGLATDLLAWREAGGVVFLESKSGLTQGIPDATQRKTILHALEFALDAHAGTHLWTLEGPEGIFRVDEWPLTRGGWIDESALPKPVEKVMKATLAPKVVATSATPTPAPSWNPLAILQEGGAGHRLVLIHGATGSVEIYRDLANAIGPVRRIVAIRSRGQSNPDACHPTVEGSAAAYLAAVLEDDPAAPFVIAGYGFGGAVAFEMVRQMLAAGRQEPGLVLIGAPAPQSGKPGDWMAGMKSVFKLMSTQTPIEPGLTDDPVFIAHETAWRRYRAVPMDIEADLIVPSDFPRDGLSGWEKLLPGVRVETMKCAWSEMLTTPSVKRLASLLESLES